jgi:hypothetical protein
MPKALKLYIWCEIAQTTSLAAAFAPPVVGLQQKRIRGRRKAKKVA